jgi:hypothetical protein
MKRRMVEVDPQVADVVRLACLLKGMTMKGFVTQALRDAVRPYCPSIESFRQLREKGPAQPLANERPRA